MSEAHLLFLMLIVCVWSIDSKVWNRKYNVYKCERHAFHSIQFYAISIDELICFWCHTPAPFTSRCVRVCEFCGEEKDISFTSFRIVRETKREKKKTTVGLVNSVETHLWYVYIFFISSDSLQLKWTANMVWFPWSPFAQPFPCNWKSDNGNRHLTETR